ncbi:carbohydrate kinase [Prolixibacteraceae bacterium JC049]|nr:carbohydrate kinase [Prolixibacteraceae bacterium JC049]
MITLGIDLGSSSVKASLFNTSNGSTIASTFFPKKEMPISSEIPGWAEQAPTLWWDNTCKAITEVLDIAKCNKNDITAIGITYQMHGLVALNNEGVPVHDAIIWCDSRAVELGQAAFNELGEAFCLENFLNSPGNFTASKLKWLKDNKPELFKQIYKIMLPGDYLNFRLTGEINTTVTGLSEGILWNYKNNDISKELLKHWDISEELLPEIVPGFGTQSSLSESVAESLGLNANTPITYRAGDQPNNAFSLNVLNPGEIAATAGTSGVIYGVSDQLSYDPQSRINSFAHVNHTAEENRIGILFCLNGAGIFNSWTQKNITPHLSYPEMNELALKAPIGAEGLLAYPFGNGAERMLENKQVGGQFKNLNFNIHNSSHMVRSVQESIAFSFFYGLSIMRKTGMPIQTIKAGMANMFLSELFTQTLADLSGAKIELYNTDGAVGAARSAALGAGIYSSAKEAFDTLEVQQVIQPKLAHKEAVEQAYANWLNNMEQ